MMKTLTLKMWVRVFLLFKEVIKMIKLYKKEQLEGLKAEYPKEVIEEAEEIKIMAGKK